METLLYRNTSYAILARRVAGAFDSTFGFFALMSCMLENYFASTLCMRTANRFRARVVASFDSPSQTGRRSLRPEQPELSTHVENLVENFRSICFPHHRSSSETAKTTRCLLIVFLFQVSQRAFDFFLRFSTNPLALTGCSLRAQWFFAINHQAGVDIS